MKLFGRHQTMLALVVPFAAFFLLDILFRSLDSYRFDQSDLQQGVDATLYLTVVIARVLVIGMFLAIFTRTYLALFPFRIDYWGLIVGVLGAVLWIGICYLQIESSLLFTLGCPEDWLAKRDAVNPFLLYSDPRSLGVFLVFRFALLVMMVPIAEELFLRGFLMRAMDSENWENVPLAKIGSFGLVVGTLYGMVSHPGEMIAATVWFSLVTVLMVKTNRFWNCVLAHVVTNLILGIYICQTENWQLW